MASRPKDPNQLRADGLPAIIVSGAFAVTVLVGLILLFLRH